MWNRRYYLSRTSGNGEKVSHYSPGPFPRREGLGNPVPEIERTACLDGFFSLSPSAPVISVKFVSLNQGMYIRICRLDCQGIERIQSGDRWINLVCQQRSSPSNPVKMEMQPRNGFFLEAVIGNMVIRRSIQQGRMQVTLK